MGLSENYQSKQNFKWTVDRVVALFTYCVKHMYTQLAMLLLGAVCGHTPQLKTCAPEIESGSSFD